MPELPIKPTAFLHHSDRQIDLAARKLIRLLEAAKRENRSGRFGVLVSSSTGDMPHCLVVEETRETLTT